MHGLERKEIKPLFMKETALSLANLVYVQDLTQETTMHDCGDVFLVVGINHFTVELMLSGADLTRSNAIPERIANLSPIPLTGEWLVKFGFTCHGSIWKLNDFELCMADADCYLSVGGVIVGHSINAVHQLQNIYHALSGMELVVR